MQTITDIDFIILNFIHEKLSCGFLNILMPIITFLGNAGAVWFAAAIAMFFFKKYRDNSFLIIAGLACVYVIGNLILKNIVARARPFSINTAVELLISAPTDYSFPSGHTMSSFAAAVILCHTDKRPGGLALILAFLIAFSRLYLYVHFPSDVIAGLFIGAAIGQLVWVIGNKIKKFKTK